MTFVPSNGPTAGISNLDGFGTNTITGILTGSSEMESGTINVTGFMVTSGGISGNSNYLMSACRDCDECYDITDMTASDLTPETIGNPGAITITVDDGKPPFTWSLDNNGGDCSTSDGARWTLDEVETQVRTNILRTTDILSKGSRNVQTTDLCGTVVNQEIRCTNGSWQNWHNTCQGWPCDRPGPGTQYAEASFVANEPWGCIKQGSTACGGGTQQNNPCGTNNCRDKWGTQPICLTPWTCDFAPYNILGDYACCKKVVADTCKAYEMQAWAQRWS